MAAPPFPSGFSVASHFRIGRLRLLAASEMIRRLDSAIAEYSFASPLLVIVNQSATAMLTTY